jgi:Lrp/AsnC family transcriptional regulator for asnA, asnC and gidA
MNAKNYDLDNIDLQLLSLLMADATIPYTEIGKKLFVSASTVHVRIKKMEGMGIIVNQQLVINPAKLGYDITAFIGIYLEKSSLYDQVLEGLRQVREVVEVNYTTGVYSMFVKLICRDTNHLKEILHDKLQKISGIQRTETFISLEESISRPILLLNDN